MKTTEFDSKITAAQLNESMFKKFGVKVNFDSYTREELENYRNLIRTNISQYENQNNFNDLLTDESYQKNKHLVNLLNQKIKEMLGESAQKDKKMKKTNEGKKAKPDFLDVDGDGNKKETMKKAVTDKKVKEGENRLPTKKTAERDVELPSGAKVKSRTYQGHQSQKADKEGKFKKTSESTKAKKDWDGDGEVETNKDEVWGSRAKAAKKAGKPFKESREIFRSHVRTVNESLRQLINEDEEGKAKAITAASDMVNDYTTWMQRVGQYQTKSMIELADEIRAEFGQAEAEAFKQAVAPALSQTLDILTSQREAISQAVAVLAGEATQTVPMGAGATEPEGMDGLEADTDSMNAGGDEFGASDAAAGGPEAAGRELRESKLRTAHSIMRSLSK